MGFEKILRNHSHMEINTISQFREVLFYTIVVAALVNLQGNAKYNIM